MKSRKRIKRKRREAEAKKRRRRGRGERRVSATPPKRIANVMNLCYHVTNVTVTLSHPMLCV
jgi:hypothetical protein